MRAALALLLGLALVGGPALAQKRPAPQAAASATSTQLGLRGASDQDDQASRDNAAKDGSSLPLPMPAPLPSLLSPLAVQRPEPGRCRLSCASNYYFCLSNDATDASCPDTWSQCRAACDAPSGARQITTIPGG